VTDGHLTDEQLSSHLDGMSGLDRDDGADQEVGEHVAACAECRERLAGLEAARELVRTPVPVLAPDVRAASIATVLREAEGATVDDPSHAHPAKAPVPVWTPRRPRVLVGWAAAALVLAVAVGVPLALSSHGASSNSSASAPSTPAASAASAQQHRASASGTAGLSVKGYVVISDLGTFSSLGELRSRVTTALSMDVAGSRSGAAPSPQGAAPTTTGPLAATTTTGAPGVAATTATTATTSATATTGAGSSGQSTFNGAAALGTFARCLSPAIHAAGSNRTVQFVANAEYRGSPALVYVFRPTSGGSAPETGAHSLAVVTARDGCRVLGTTPI
jgi:hypothetical protein